MTILLSMQIQAEEMFTKRAKEHQESQHLSKRELKNTGVLSVECRLKSSIKHHTP